MVEGVVEGVVEGDVDGVVDVVVDDDGVGAAVEPEVVFHTPEYEEQVLRSGICWLSQSVK